MPVRRRRDLHSTRYSQAYQQRLDLAWLSFIAFFTESSDGLQLHKLASSPKLATHWLCKFLQHLYEMNAEKKLTEARHAILAMEKQMRDLKGRLTEAWEVLESWRQEIPGQLRVPIFLPAVLAMAITARLLAFEAGGSEGYQWMVHSILLECGFFALLRPGELYALRRDLVSLPGQLLGNAVAFAVVGIECPKNRRQLGRFQFATVRSENSSSWLSWICQGLVPGERLWTSTGTDFRKRFKTLLWYLGLDTQNFVPASLRAGGATYLFMHGVDPPRLKFYGRWASERSLAHYLQESITYQLANSTSIRAQRLVALALREGHCMLTPPSLPPSALFQRKPTRGSLRGKVTAASAAVGPSVVVPEAREWEDLYPSPK